jgi:hypothetical protein
MISLSPVRAGYSIVIFLPAAIVPSKDFPVISLSMMKLLLSARSLREGFERPSSCLFDCNVLSSTVTVFNVVELCCGCSGRDLF